MRGIVLGLAGQIGSGKSTVARALASSIRCECASFGDYVRTEAARQKRRSDREELQNLGHDLLEARRPEGFCTDVLCQEAPDYVPGGNLVVDGVRHIDVVHALRKLVYPSAFALIYVQVDWRTRQRRLLVREGDAGTRNADRHDTERDVRGGLRGLADLTLVSTRPSGELVRAILAWRRNELAYWEQVS